MNTSASNGESIYLVIELPNGNELEHKKVPTNIPLWNILLQFESQYNNNLCKRYNKENRYELPQILYNSYPFASTLKQLLTTNLSDITKHKQNQSQPMRLRLTFKAQAFSIHELDEKLSKIQTELKKQEKESSMDIDTKNDDDDDDDDGNDTPKRSGLSKDFAKDIDPDKAMSTEQIFRKMERLLYDLTKSLPDKAAFVSCMKLLRKIVNNLVLHPIGAKDSSKNKDPEKYRKLNLKNEKLQSNVFQYKSAMDLLCLIGFEAKDSYLILEKDRENMVVFQALVVKISNCQPPKEAVPVVDREMKIYLLDDLRKFKVEEARIIAQENAQNAQSEASLATQHRLAAQRAYKKHHPTELMGQELREKKYGVKQKEYRFTVIHIEFPSKYVLEAKFHPNAPISKLFEFVNSALDDTLMNIKYELLLPPRQVIKNQNDENYTFKSVGGMIPACTVRFVLDAKKAANVHYDGFYIKNDLISKYLTKNITSMRNRHNVVKDESEEKKDSNGNNSNNNQRKNGKMTAAEFKAMKKKKALQNKLAKLNR